MTSALTIYSFDCRASGLFALDKNVKVLKGSLCGLNRDRNNKDGTFILFMRPFLLLKQVSERIHIVNSPQCF